MRENRYLPWIAVVGFVISATLVLPAFARAQTGAPGGWGGGGHFGMRGGMAPGIFGTVSAVNGTTLTVTGKTRPNASSTPGTAYTVDASNAQFLKDGVTSTISSVAIGDMVMVQGTVSGTNVAATMIRDGIGKMGGGSFGRNASSTPFAPRTPPIQGNGEPVVAGSIASISGTTLTVTNASNVTYTIDASGATIIKNGTSTTLSNVATGDNVVVQGTVNGTSVTASSVIDQGGGATTHTPASGSHFDLFGAIGNFFKHLFGF